MKSAFLAAEPLHAANPCPSFHISLFSPPLGQSALSLSPLGGVKPHTSDTYWAAAPPRLQVEPLRRIRGEVKKRGGVSRYVK